MLDSPKRSALISACLHAGAIALVLALTSAPSRVIPRTLRDRLYIPLDLSPRRNVTLPKQMGGGGGGQRDSLPARFGVLPRLATREFVAPTPKLPERAAPIIMEPTLLSTAPPQIQMVDLSKLGSPNGVHHGDSGGAGSGGGIGDYGDGGGVGNKHGPGLGDQDGPGIFSGDAGMSNADTAPVLLWKTEPEYSEEARRAKIQGTVVMRIAIDSQGRPRDPKILQHLGLGLDERAVETVMRWKFRPASKNGKPVAAFATIEVSFRLL